MRYCLTRIVLSLLLLATPMLMGGCLAAAAVASKLKPQPTQPAAYKLNGLRTAVRVDANEARLGTAATAFDVDPLASSLRAALKQHAEVPVALSPVGAQRIIVVELQPREDDDVVIGSQFAPGSAAGRVRVLSGDGRELWPNDGGGGRYISAAVPAATAGSALEIRRQAMHLLGEQIAKLFYKHVIEE